MFLQLTAPNHHNRATLLNRLRTRLFPRPPTQWPQYAHDCGWAPTAKEPLYPFNAHNLPPKSCQLFLLKSMLKLLVQQI